MITKNISYRVAVAALSVALVSCGDKMDYKETNLLDKDYVTRNFNYVQNYMVQCYNYIDYDFGNYSGAMLSSATDESEYSHSGNEIADFYNGAWSPSNPKSSIWSSAYNGINYCNHMLDELQGLTFPELVLNADYQKQMYNYNNFKWEARWLRAYYYFLLVRQYGGVPLKTRIMTGDENNALATVTADEIFSFIDSECTEVAANCIEDFTNLGDMSRGATENGRADKLAALALRARAALYHASPLFNPNNDTELWHKAATACKELLDACTARGMALCPTYSSLWSATSYSTAAVLKEWIFHRGIAKSNNFEYYNFPVGYQTAGGGNCPTQNLVDAYDMQATGKGIDESGSGYDPANPWTGRDPRLEMTIAHNGDQWPSDYYAQTGEVLQTYQGGLNGEPLTYATPTSYYLKKYCASSTILRSGYTTSEYHTWMNFRLGEAYLNYAEAVFQYFKALGRSNAAYAINSEFNMSAKDAASKTRQRAGMPAIVTGLSNDEFWAKYQKERQVELAFEGHRFFDVRRWKEGAKWFKSITELKITKNADGTFTYTRQQKSRLWEEKMNLFPVPQTEIMKSGGLITQNPGW
ncbi:MAG: RagB/SusD family nutrient uptake outer membrane protein [Prevotella sp.]|nr:RagB/SusD family nutrient uptake outer membrane protein [Prevotella sp.]